MENSKRPLLLTLGIYIFLLQWILTNQQVNLALRGIATQSSLFDNHYDATRAIDGNKASDMNSQSCACTSGETNPWWRVDLLEVYAIARVSITNRGDCCPDRINGAEIHIGNSLDNNGNNNPRCVVISSIAAGATANYTCNMSGRYVNVIIPSNQYLTLCEVEVYAGTKKALLKIKLDGSKDLTNPTMRDNVLQKIKSATNHSSVLKVSWTKEPEEETKH